MRKPKTTCPACSQQVQPRPRDGLLVEHNVTVEVRRRLRSRKTTTTTSVCPGSLARPQ